MSTRSSPQRRRARIGRRFIMLAAFTMTPLPSQAEHPHALWHVVHDLCVVDRRLTGLPAPCLEVNLAAGYAVVPDPRKPAHLLLVPTRRLTGIEDPGVLESGTPNYWQQAWAARRGLVARVGGELPRDAIALAINPIIFRSQDQLHIHISCILPPQADALKLLEPRLGERWSSQEILGRRWRVRTLVGEDLGVANPFRLVADTDPVAASNMGRQTIVVVGARLRAGAGFYILARSSEADTNDKGSAEHMLDEGCAAAGKVARPS